MADNRAELDAGGPHFVLLPVRAPEPSDAWLARIRNAQALLNGVLYAPPDHSPPAVLLPPSVPSAGGKRGRTTFLRSPSPRATPVAKRLRKHHQHH